MKRLFSAIQSGETNRTSSLSFIAERNVQISNNFDIGRHRQRRKGFFLIKCNRLAQHDRSEIIASVFLALVCFCSH